MSLLKRSILVAGLVIVACARRSRPFCGAGRASSKSGKHSISSGIATVDPDDNGANIVRNIDEERDRFRNGLQCKPLQRRRNEAAYRSWHRKRLQLVRGIGQGGDSGKNQRSRDKPGCNSEHR
ncbi:MAG: hypothetical protein ACLQPN_19215 [Bryobacteraceae bacterium]